MKRTLALPLLFMLATQACDDEEPTEDTLDHAVGSMSAVMLEGALFIASTRAITNDDTPDAAANKTRTDINAVLRPEPGPKESCVTTEVEGAEVRMHLSGCRGPRGLSGLTGHVKVVFGVGLRGLKARMTTRDLKANHASFDIRAEALVININETGRNALEVVTDTTATGLAKKTLRRRGAYALEWTPDDDPFSGPKKECVRLDGAWSTEVERATWSTVATGVERCAARCAHAGEITYTNERSGASLTIALDGTSEPSFTTSRGESGTLDLACVPAPSPAPT